MGLHFSDDAFGVERYAAHRIVQDLLEAWTPQRKDEIVRRMREQRHAELVEHVQIGNFDLVLWFYVRLDLYAVSLNSGQEDPTTPEGQKERRAQPKAEPLRWHGVVAQLRRWTQDRGQLLIGSVWPAKTAQYRRMLARHFLIATWSESPGEGFFILPD